MCKSVTVLKIISVVVLLCAILSLAIGQASAAVRVGDVNKDNNVNPLDRQRLARYLAKWDGYDNIGGREL